MIKVKESTVLQTAAAELVRLGLACLAGKGSGKGSEKGSGEAGSQFFVNETR